MFKKHRIFVQIKKNRILFAQLQSKVQKNIFKIFLSFLKFSKFQNHKNFNFGKKLFKIFMKK